MEFCPYVKANNCGTCLEDGSCFAQAKYTIFKHKARIKELEEISAKELTSKRRNIRELEANLEKTIRIIKGPRLEARADGKVVEQFLYQFDKPKQTESETVKEICTLSDHLRKPDESEIEQTPAQKMVEDEIDQLRREK